MWEATYGQRLRPWRKLNLMAHHDTRAPDMHTKKHRRSSRFLTCLGLALSFSLVLDKSFAQTPPFSGTMEGWHLEMEVAPTNQAWFYHDERGPYRVARHGVMDAQDLYFDAYAITDEAGELAKLPRDALEELVWAFEMSTAANVIAENAALEGLRILEAEYENVVVQHVNIEVVTELQERAIQGGVVAVGAYFGGINLLMQATPGWVQGELTGHLLQSPNSIAKAFALGIMNSEHTQLRRQIGWLENRLSSQLGRDASSALYIEDVRRAYQRSLRIWTYLEPAAEYLVALQDDASFFGQFKRLLGVATSTALPLAPGATTTQIGALLDAGDLVGALEQSADGFLDFREQIETRHMQFVSGVAGAGDIRPETSRTWLILNSALSPENQTIGNSDFVVSVESYPITEDFEMLARSVFGPSYRMASWEEVSERYMREGGEFLRAAGLVQRGEDGIAGASVTVNGRHSRGGSRRHYFFAWGNVPSSFAVHDRVVFDGVPLNLGSWHTNQYLFATNTERR